MQDLICAVHVLGQKPGKRIGLVKWYETGYYVSQMDKPHWTTEQVNKFIHDWNLRRGISDDVSESAMAGSMFGWHVPAAQDAIQYFKGLQ